MGKDAFKYLGLCIGFNLLLALIEIFILRPLVDFVGTNFITHVIVYNILFIIINPTIVALLIKKLFKFEYKIESNNNPLMNNE